MSKNRLQFGAKIYGNVLASLRNMKSIGSPAHLWLSRRRSWSSGMLGIFHPSLISWPLGSVPTFPVLVFLWFSNFLPCHATSVGHFSFRPLRILYFWPVWEAVRSGGAKKSGDTGSPILIKLQFILLQYLSPPGHIESKPFHLTCQPTL